MLQTQVNSGFDPTPVDQLQILTLIGKQLPPNHLKISRCETLSAPVHRGGASTHERGVVRHDRLADGN